MYLRVSRQQKNDWTWNDDGRRYHTAYMSHGHPGLLEKQTSGARVMCGTRLLIRELLQGPAVLLEARKKLP
jgi:hypothetical protein